MRSAIPFIAIAACFFITAGCSSQPKQFKEKKLIIPSNQTVKIDEIDLSITNHGCGREWVNGEGDRPMEKVFCDLKITLKDSVIISGHDQKPVYIGNYQVTIDRMNPWNRVEDSIPPGGCRVWVRRVEGR